MSWSYSGNPASSALDEVRFLTTDTNQTKPYTLQDEEINYAISLYSDNPPVIGRNFWAASICLDTILGKYKGIATSKGVGDLHLDFNTGVKFFQDLGYRLRQKANMQKVVTYFGGQSLAEKAEENARVDRVQPAAKIDGMNNINTVDNNIDPSIEP